MALSALEKIKVTGQLTAALGELNTAANAIAKVKAAKAVTELLARLGVGQAQAEPASITDDQKTALLKELRRLYDSGDWGDSTRYSYFSKRIHAAADGEPVAVEWAKNWLNDLTAESQAQADYRAEVSEQNKDIEERLKTELDQGNSSNPYFQAYLDTLENPADRKGYEYTAFISKMDRLLNQEFTGERTDVRGVATEEYRQAKAQFIRNWADQNLSSRVKAQRVQSESVQPEPEPQQAPPPASLAEVASNPEPEQPDQPQHQIIEYTTKRGKVLRGVIRTDLTYAQAKAIDEYTWKMNGGWFIRERHLSDQPASAEGQQVQQVEKAVKVEPTPEELAARELAKRQEKANKLLEAGQNVIDRADSVINQDRKTNTHRRASMAAGVIQREEGNRALGVTMQNIANGILDGEVNHLNGITAKAQLESLERILRLARYSREKGLSYQQQRELKDMPLEKADADNATFPQVKLRNHGQFMRVVEEKAIRGYKKFLSSAQY